MSGRRLGSMIRLAIAAGAALAAVPHAMAANFQFGTMIRAGLSGNSDYELGVGTNSNSPASTGQVNPYFGGQARFFEIGYLKTTNTAYVKVYQNVTPTGTVNQVSFNPVGGAATPANVIWRLPATSFFAQATNNTSLNLVSVSSLTLSGVSGPLNVIQPLQSTSLLAYQFGISSQPSVSQSQDIVFRADASGSWRLQGTILMLGLQSNGGTASGGDLEFGVSALAGTPEPASIALTMLGVAGMVAFARKRSMRK